MLSIEKEGKIKMEENRSTRKKENMARESKKQGKD